MGFSKYPNEIDDSLTLPPSTDLITPVKAEVVNRLRDAILAIEFELGQQPSSVFATVKARLDSMDSEINSIASGVATATDLLALEAEVTALEALVNAHNANVSNPHSVTAAQVGAPNLLGSSTDEAIVRFDGASGQMQNSSAGPFVTNTGDIRMAERVGDPTNVADSGFLYTKDVSSVTELFYIDSSGFTTQLSASGAAPVTGSGTDNTITRWDGTNAIQDSGITLDDSDNISGATSISIGATPSSTGVIRVGNNSEIKSRNAADSIDISLIYTDTNNTIRIGGNGTGGAQIDASGTLNLNTSTISFVAAVANPIIAHGADGAADATGGLFAINAQDVSGAGTTITGGAMFVRAGDAAGSATNEIGGALTLRPGSGTTTDGIFTIQDGSGTSKFTVSAAGETNVNAASLLSLDVTGTARMHLTSSYIESRVSSIRFRSNLGSPTISQDATVGAGTDGADLTFNSQDSNGTGTKRGGHLDIRAGDATNGTDTGGNLTHRPGSGTTDGVLSLKTGSGVSNFTITATGETNINAISIVSLQTSGATRAQIGSSFFQLINGATTFQWAANIIAPQITQSTDGNNGITADTLTISAQTASGTSTTGGSLSLNAGSGTSLDGDVNIGGANTNAINIGNATDDPVVNILGAGDFRLDSQIRFTERAGDPANVANTGFLYTKDDTAVTQLYYEDSAGTITQLTSAGGTAVTGTGTDNRIARWNGTNAVQDSGITIDDSDNVSGLTTLSFGAIPSLTGTIRLSNSSQIYGRNGANTADAPLFSYDGSNNISIGSNSTTVQSTLIFNSPNVANAGVRISCNYFGFSENQTNPIFNQQNEDDSVSSQDLTIHAQDNVFAGSTGGDLILRAGSGLTTDGVLRIKDPGGTDRIQIASGNPVLSGSSAIDFYINGAGPVWRQFQTFTQVGVSGFQFTSGVVSPTISYQDSTVADEVADTLFIIGQDVSGSGTTIAGGDLSMRAGDSSGGTATNESGGNVYIRPGTGGAGSGVAGVIELRDSTATSRVSVDGSTVEFGSTTTQFLESSGDITFGYDTKAGGASGDDLTIHGQDATSGGTAGDLIVRAGENAAGGGGTLELHAGSGSGLANHGWLALVGGDNVWRFEIDNNQNIDINAITDIDLEIGGNSRLLVSDTITELGLATFQFASTVLSPMILQEDEAGAGISGELITFHGQDSIGTGTKSGGGVLVRAGNASGGTDTGGDLSLQAGLGDTDGSVFINSGDETARITVDSTLITLGHSALRFDDILDADCSIGISSTADDGYDLFVQAQESTGENNTGGTLHVLGGAGTNATTGNGGAVLVAGGTGAGTGTDGNIALHALPSEWNSGEHIMFMRDRVTAPTGNPGSGGYIYSESGAGKWRGSSGTITTFGPAEPHCPTCGRDSALEWKNDHDGWELSLCMWCITDKLGDIGIIKKVQK